ncbi:MAG: hypothetical protein LIO44_01260, partial [Eubacterium sp.]|nr:hypothetical protein [Eubacterium sp.]
CVIDHDELIKCIEVTNVSVGTAVLRVEVTTKNPYLSQDIGKFIAYLAPNIVFYLVGADYISPFETAQFTAEKGIIGDKEALAAGFGLGFIISIIIIYFYNRYYKNIITDREDIKKFYGVYALGDIPYYDYDFKTDNELIGKDNS